MIFNPYHIGATIDGTATTAASALPWATPLLQDNALVVALVLTFVAADMLAWRHKGVMRHQLQWITDTRNARTFESTVVIYPWLKAVLLVQCFLSYGLMLYCATDSAPALHLSSADAGAWGRLGLCTAALLGWFGLQSALVNWLCYLFSQKERRTIINRTHVATFVVIAPLVTLGLVAVMSGLISSQMALNLLAALFILSQISFVLNGIKIFYDGFGSIWLIFAYLCALEIAPLLVLWAKFVTK